MRPKQIHAYLNLAEVYKEQKQRKQAIAQLKEAIQRQPRLAALYHERGLLYQDGKNPELALQDFEKVIELFGTRDLTKTEVALLAEDHTRRGMILHERKQLASARQAYDVALKLRPDFPMALAARGTLSHEQGRHEEALRDFDAYLKKRPAM